MAINLAVYEQIYSDVYKDITRVLPFAGCSDDPEDNCEARIIYLMSRIQYTRTREEMEYAVEDAIEWGVGSRAWYFTHSFRLK